MEIMGGAKGKKGRTTKSVLNRCVPTESERRKVFLTAFSFLDPTSLVLAARACSIFHKLSEEAAELQASVIAAEFKTLGDTDLTEDAMREVNFEQSSRRILIRSRMSFWMLLVVMCLNTSFDNFLSPRFTFPLPPSEPKWNLGPGFSTGWSKSLLK